MPARSLLPWLGVIGLTLIQAVAGATGFYGSTVYVSALSDEPRHFSVAVVSVAAGGFMLVGGLGGIPVARWIERFGPRPVMALGAVVMAAGVAGLGRAGNEAEMIVAYAVMGLGFSALTVVPTGQLVALWFTGQSRNMAMAVAFMGFPLGGGIGVPVISHLVRTRGFTETTGWLALALLGVVVPIALLLRERWHEDPGDGQPSERTPAAAREIAFSTPAAEALRSRWFMLVTAALALGMVSQIGALTQLYSALSDRAGAATAASTVSVLTTASLIGRAVGSWALGRVGLMRSAVTLLAAQGCALGGIVAFDAGAGLVLSAVLLGMSVGNMQVIQPLLLVDRFGPAEFPRILAVGNLFSTMGMSIGPLVVGAGVTWGIGYGGAFCLLVGCCFVGCLLLLAAAERPRSGDAR